MIECNIISNLVFLFCLSKAISNAHLWKNLMVFYDLLLQYTTKQQFEFNNHYFSGASLINWKKIRWLTYKQDFGLEIEGLCLPHQQGCGSQHSHHEEPLSQRPIRHKEGLSSSCCCMDFSENSRALCTCRRRICEWSTHRKISQIASLIEYLKRRLRHELTYLRRSTFRRKASTEQSTTSKV